MKENLRKSAHPNLINTKKSSMYESDNNATNNLNENIVDSNKIITN